MAAVQKVTGRDVARLAGVSQSTVSRALRPEEPVPDETRRRVRSAAEALGYVPNEAGRSLSTRATRRVALVADLGNPLFATVLTPVHDRLSELGYRTVLFAEHDDQETAYAGLFDGSVDGAILSTTGLRSALPVELARRNVPFVYLNRTSDLVERDSAVADNAGGAASAAELLIRTGHRDIGMILGPATTSSSRDRAAGYAQALGRAGLAVRPEWVAHSDYSPESGRAAALEILRAASRPTALLCANDWVAVGVLNAARELGLAVPERLSVIGFDDLAPASWPVFNLTTVFNPLNELAEASATMLVDRLRGLAVGDQPRRVVGATSLVPRGTHAPPPPPLIPPRRRRSPR